MAVVIIATVGFVTLSAGSAPAAVTPPSPPRAVHAAPGNGVAVVSWTGPSSNGGAAIDSYEVITYLNESPRPINLFHSTLTTQTIIGLVNGKGYTFKVAAHNSAGWSQLSAESGTTTVGVPGAPPNVAVITGNALVALTWIAPPAAGGAINKYRVTPFLGATALAARTFVSPATAQLITGLVNGSTYTFQVKAHNVWGWGASTTSPSSTVGAPLPPTKVTGVPGGRQATISWIVPLSNHGSAIDAYRVTSYLGTVQQTAIIFNSAATSQVITGLSRGKTLRFRVEAHNARGWSDKSDYSPVITAGTPIAPTGVVAVPGIGQAVVAWTAPTITNGASVIGYEVVPYQAGVAGAARFFTTAATSQLVTGLVKAHTYRFKVAAQNGTGWGPLSVGSPAVTVK